MKITDAATIKSCQDIVWLMDVAGDTIEDAWQKSTAHLPPAQQVVLVLNISEVLQAIGLPNGPATPMALLADGLEKAVRAIANQTERGTPA